MIDLGRYRIPKPIAYVIAFVLLTVHDGLYVLSVMWRKLRGKPTPLWDELRKVGDCRRTERDARKRKD